MKNVKKIIPFIQKQIPEFVSGIKKNVPSMVGLTAFGITMGLTGVFVEKLLDKFNEMGIKAKSPAYFKKMMAAHPELLKEDPKTVAEYWRSLYHFAPHMARDPIAAGAFIRQSILKGVREEFGGPPPDTYATLSKVEESLTGNKGKYKGTVTKTIMGEKTLGKFLDI